MLLDKGGRKTLSWQTRRPASSDGKNLGTARFECKSRRDAWPQIAIFSSATLAPPELSRPDPVARAARAFLASLAPPERARASFPFGGAERTRWHWTVPSAVPRNGLPLGALTGPQRRLAFALLRTSTSPSGFRKTLDIMALQGLLQRPATGDPFDPDRYYVSVFGTPGSRVWGWRLEGHHLSRHFTIVGGRLVAEPFFLGARA